MKIITHVAGEPDEGVQRCIVCGETLIDHRNAMVIVGSGAGRFFDAGPVTRIGTSVLSAGGDDNGTPCSEEKP